MFRMIQMSGLGGFAGPMALRSLHPDRSERSARLPGDDLIPDPIGSLTHAITIRATRSRVWPWLAQMGAGSRGGWYSYDFLDNGRRPSARAIVPELQHLSAGMIFPALPGATDPVIQAVHFIMQRRQLLNIAQRAERADGTPAVAGP